MDIKENNSFSFTYSAKEQAEIKAIREKYMGPKPEDKMEKLRRLDASVTQKATAYSLIVGVLGALILGFGMSLILSDFGVLLFGARRVLTLVVGILSGIAGIILTGYAYPVYNATTKKERERVAPEILRLSEELMK